MISKQAKHHLITGESLNVVDYIISKVLRSAGVRSAGTNQ